MNLDRCQERSLPFRLALADLNRTGFTAPDGSTNTYTYDTLNRLATLANSWAGSFGFSYDALSRRTQMTRPNNITTNYTYDTLSRLSSVLHQAGGSTIDGAAYTLDAAGNRTAKTDDLAGVTSNYTCDKIYELTQAMQGANTTESYSYDAVGNRTASLGVPSYTTNSSNEMTANSNATYTYDYNGNTLTKVVGSNTTSFAWDFENRLTQVTLPGTGGTATFKYDPFGRRIEKVFTQNSTTTTTNYLYDGDNAIETVDQNGTLLARFAQGQNIDEPLAESVGGATYDYEQDGLGSVTSLSNAAGALANTYTYDSFGKLTGSTGSVTNPFQYTARESDTETGLYYYRARYFDPATGRFLTEDPIRFDAGSDFYVYVGNGPTGSTDPLGFDKCENKKPCGIKKGPEYNVSGSIKGGAGFFWKASFLSDATHDPRCCEVRQLVSWHGPLEGVPHAGFPSTDQPDQWYEDRDEYGKRYGRRNGPYSDLHPGFDWYDGNDYEGADRPEGFPTGETVRFRLVVVDVCNGHKTIYTSKTLSVNF